MSAADMQLVGWPEPASAVDSSEWRRSFCAIWKRTASVGAMAAVVLSSGEARFSKRRAYPRAERTVKQAF